MLWALASLRKRSAAAWWPASEASATDDIDRQQSSNRQSRRMTKGPVKVGLTILAAWNAILQLQANTMKTRIESDSMGNIEVPADRYWGAQTQRSLQHFAIGEERMPLPVVHALALIKKAAALTNGEPGNRDSDPVELITRAADEVLTGHLDEHFPLAVWQTNTSSAARVMSSTRALSRFPSSPLVRAAAFLISARACTTGSGMRSSPIAKCCSERWVWAPQ